MADSGGPGTVVYVQAIRASTEFRRIAVAGHRAAIGDGGSTIGECVAAIYGRTCSDHDRSRRVGVILVGWREKLTALATVFNSGEEIVRCFAGRSAERDCLSTSPTSGTDTIGERAATHSVAVASRVSTRRIQKPSVKTETENDSRIASSGNPVANARVSDGACWGGRTASEKCQPVGPAAHLGSIAGARHVAIRIGSDRPSGCDLIATIYRQCQSIRTSGASVRGGLTALGRVLRSGKHEVSRLTIVDTGGGGYGGAAAIIGTGKSSGAPVVTIVGRLHHHPSIVARSRNRRGHLGGLGGVIRVTSLICPSTGKFLGNFQSPFLKDGASVGEGALFPCNQ